ncbi:MAG: autotransporter outer membrane beta-barrel domain-containing protein, partial [Desulfovibrio sp.]|nr:autotransporter outer membrane beta-barrel domain-containing protein [Desulfovibrio sp.]
MGRRLPARRAPLRLRREPHGAPGPCRAFHRSHESGWTDWSGAFMLGAGRDWFFGEEKSVRLGPLATIQYAFTSHPDFEEDGGAEALRIDGGTADSLAFMLGAHLGASREIGSGCRLDAEEEALGACVGVLASAGFEAVGHEREVESCREAVSELLVRATHEPASRAVPAVRGAVGALAVG